MRVVIYCGNTPSEKMKLVMGKFLEERHKIIPRNPDYFETSAVDKSAELVIVSESHPQAQNIKTRYETSNIKTRFVVEDTKTTE